MPLSQSKGWHSSPHKAAVLVQTTPVDIWCLGVGTGGLSRTTKTYSRERTERTERSASMQCTRGCVFVDQWYTFAVHAQIW